MLGLFGISLMSGLWAGYSTSPRPITDINGHAIAVGDTVKVVCVVTAVDDVARHFNAVSVRPIHPEGDNILTKEIFQVDPKQLLYGS